MQALHMVALLQLLMRRLVLSDDGVDVDDSIGDGDGDDDGVRRI